MRRVRWVSMAVATLAVLGCASPGPPPWTGPPAGVVVLHAEGEDPYGHTLHFTRTLQAYGLLTDSPEMPWSPRRANDAGAERATKEIDEAVARLRSRAAKKIFIAGESFGASSAVRYAALRRLDGLVALEPGPLSELPQLARLAAAVRPGTPVLWAVGKGEGESLKRAGRLAFEALPKNPPAKFVEVGGYRGTPSEAATLVADWIREVANQ